MTPSTTNPRPAFKTPASRARYLAAYDAALAEWPVPCEELDLPTRLGSTHVIASGPPDAPPLLLLPSLAASAMVWRLNVASLSRHFRTYAVDVIGQPGKSMASRRIRGRRRLAGWLTDLLDGLGVRRASIVGCSFGGFLALNQAALAPDRVERIVLISPVGGFASQYWRLTYLMRIKGPLLKLIHRFRRKAGKQIAWAPPRDPLWAALIGVTMVERPRIGVSRAPAFGGAELRAIRAPTLLLIGEQERLYEPQAFLKLAQARMPGLRGAIVPGADHIAALAQPDEINTRIIEFLR